MAMITDAYVLKYGQSTLPLSQILRGGDPAVLRPISFCIYLLQTPQRNILVDAGCDTMPGFVMEHFCSPTEILKRLKLSPAQITDVILTHAHHDHVEALHHFSNATVYIQENALTKARPYMQSNENLVAFSTDIAVTNAIRVVHIGGHATGSCVVNFKYGKHDYTIVGDECYTSECITRGIPTGVSHDLQKSIEFLKDYANRRLLYCHDPSILPNANGFLRLSERPL